MARVAPRLPFPPARMLVTLWLLSLGLPALRTQTLISCSYKSLCRRALLSGNDVVLQCDHPKARWFFSSIQDERPSPVSSLSNSKKLPGGSLQLTDPHPTQSGLYRCQDLQGALLVGYKVDFQDVGALHITHRDLDQAPLHNETAQLGGRVLLFTHWEPWQDCSRCGEPGERKRLGYCYVQEEPPEEEPMPCGLYLRGAAAHSHRLRPELQVEACHVPCDHSRETSQPYFIFDLQQFSTLTRDTWLTCPLASIYR